MLKRLSQPPGHPHTARFHHLTFLRRPPLSSKLAICKPHSFLSLCVSILVISYDFLVILPPCTFSSFTHIETQARPTPQSLLLQLPSTAKPSIQPPIFLNRRARTYSPAQKNTTP